MTEAGRGRAAACLSPGARRCGQQPFGGRVRGQTPTGTVPVGFAAITVLAADASAMYHPTLGRFVQRDPRPEDDSAPVHTGQYQDGMNLMENGGGYRMCLMPGKPAIQRITLYWHDRPQGIPGVHALGIIWQSRICLPSWPRGGHCRQLPRRGRFPRAAGRT